MSGPMAYSLGTLWFNVCITNSFYMGIKEGINSGDTADVFLQKKTLEALLYLAELHVGHTENQCLF